MEQTVPAVTASGSMATPYNPHSTLDEQIEGPWLTGNRQRERRVSFGSVFDASSGTSGNDGNGGTFGAAVTQTAQA